MATGGCQVVLSAGIEAERDGSGVVRAAVGLDDEALRQLGDPAAELRLDDLREAGWSVAPPGKEPDGLTWVRLSKPFADADQAGRVTAELSGPGGPFRQFRLERRRSLLRTTTELTGVVDLTAGLGGLSDEGLQAALGDAAPALDAAALAGHDVRVRVEARLPGEEPRVWEPELGEELRLEARSDVVNVRLLGGAAAAVVFTLAALVLLRRRP
ncbi:MAG: hypothetical protein ACLGI2_18160 [Acidimicrobiia bacterium]